MGLKRMFTQCVLMCVDVCCVLLLCFSLCCAIKLFQSVELHVCVHNVRRSVCDTFTLATIVHMNEHEGVWRNGSVSDSRSEGWEFESLCPHFTLFVPVRVCKLVRSCVELLAVMYELHEDKSGVAQWLACWAHNPKVRGSKPRSAIYTTI